MSIWYRGDPRGKKIKSRSKGDSEIKRQIKQSKKEGEKVFIRMMINDYICKDKTWEDLQKTFRPSGAMSQWSRDMAELVGLKTTTNYRLMSPPSSPTSSPGSSPGRGQIKKKKKKKKKKKLTKKLKKLTKKLTKKK